MKTTEEIIEYLEMELKEAYEQYDNAQDKQERLFQLITAATITRILDAIKK